MNLLLQSLNAVSPEYKSWAQFESAKSRTPWSADHEVTAKNLATSEAMSSQNKKRVNIVRKALQEHRTL